MLERLTARSGQPIVRIGGIHLHSPYDPEKEARRFVRQSIRQPNPSMILLLGAGLGYLYQELSRSFPSAAVMVVFYHQALLQSFTPPLTPGTYWHPGESTTLLQFLRSRIHELEAEGVAVAEWPASARAFPEASLLSNQAVHQLFREIRGSLVTTAALGRRWLRNSLANFLCIEEVHLPAFGKPGRDPIVIAASGPSLCEGADFLAARRESIELWALPSSLDFLLGHGLVPDTVVMTDPGYYAFSHLRCAARGSLHLTMPLTAACGSWRISARVSLVNQGTPAEQALLEQAGLAVPAVPAQGTVAATALLLALGRRKGPVIFAGLDLCYRDIVSHVRPNNFENWLDPGTNRLDSLHHRLFALAAEQAPAGAGGKRGSSALDTYAGWFREIGSGGGRIYRLHPSEIELPGMESIGEEGLDRLIRTAGNGAGNGRRGTRNRRAPRQEPLLPTYPPRDRRARIVSAVLAGWIEQTEQLITSAGATASLEPLLRDPHTLSMLYLCNAAELTEIRRIRRLQGEQAAAGKTRALLQKHRIFLQDLARLYSEAV